MDTIFQSSLHTLLAEYNGERNDVSQLSLRSWERKIMNSDRENREYDAAVNNDISCVD